MRDRRTELHLTQEELADRVGRTSQWVVRFESRFAGGASLDNVINLLDALGLYAEVGESDDDADPMFMDVDLAEGIDE